MQNDHIHFEFILRDKMTMQINRQFKVAMPQKGFIFH